MTESVYLYGGKQFAHGIIAMLQNPSNVALPIDDVLR